MGVKIRLSRMGTKKRPFYRIVAVDARKKRDGEYLERLGLYQPLKGEDHQIVVEEERLRKWLSRGAQPTHIVRTLLNKKGIQLK